MSTPDLLLSFSRDARHFAYKENQNSNLFLYNINRQTKHFVSSPNATCFSFSPDGLFLAFGDNLGNVCIYSLKTLGIISKFENLSNKSTPIISTLFSKNYLISADANSTVYVSNPDKQISKLNVFDKYHFQSKANFENIGPVKNLLPYTEESNSAVIYVSFEHSFILLNVSSGKFSKKINSVPCILDPSFPVCRSTAFNDEYLIKVDANTIIKFRNKGKYQEPLTNSYDLIFKKRFFNRIVGLSTTVDSHSLIVENNGVLNILKNDKGSGMIKAKLVIKENNNNNTNKPKRRRNQNSENIEKNESKAHFDNQKSQILSAHVLQACNIYILYGSDFNNFKLKILNFDEFLASADENKNILIKIDDSENTLSVREEIQNGQMVSTLIKSDKNLDFEDLSSHKRKLTVKEIKTIGETLEERLEENLLISEEASKTSSKNKSDLNTNDINSNDRSLTIAQALQAENINIVKDIVLESCENGEIIYYSIKNFGKSFIPLLVRVLSQFVKDNQNNFKLSDTSLEWLKLLLKIHPNYILSNASKSHKSLMKIHEMADEKRKYSSLLGKLNGKISYFLQDGQEKSSSNSLKFSNIQNMSRSLHGEPIKPQFIYEADNDNTSDSISSTSSEAPSEDEMSDDDLVHNFENENDFDGSIESNQNDQKMTDSEVSSGSDENESSDEDSDNLNNNIKKLKFSSPSKIKRKAKNGGRKVANFGGMESPDSENEVLV